ncbi:fimbrial protein [Klebsiella oxytoca]|uniref:fimbrial protein n=1 Tax=Klebsiella oxytoca TaxID=571 RepID=UPI0020C1DAA2|nr:fimbrial protein [Klebsiella oxytoca]
MHKDYFHLNQVACCVLVMLALHFNISLASSSLTTPATAQNEQDARYWHGRATFSGQVITPACTLMMEDAWQSVEMGGTPVRDLQMASVGPRKHFKLRLRNCELVSTDAQSAIGSGARVIFEGNRGETAEHFMISGQATGVDLQIFDRAGDIARVGEALPLQQLYGKSNELDYTLRIIRNGKPLSAGNYYAALRFRVDYE